MVKDSHPLIYSGAPPEKVAEDLKPLIRFQEKGLSLKELSALLEERLIPHLAKYDRPEFQSLYNCFPEEGAEFGAALALRYNQGVTNWQVSPGAVMMEELCGQALCRVFGLKKDSEATFMYCGTYANQEALYLALHRKAEQHGFDLGKKGLTGFENPPPVVICSQEAHLSLRHAVRMMGLGERSLVSIPADSNRRMRIKELKDKVQKLSKTQDVFCIVSTAGTTSTGTIDPILPISEVCEEFKIWHHVDGAYGLAFSLLPERRHLFEGLDRADSIVWDPHKQFGTPIPNSLLFVRNKEDFEPMAIYGEYFNRKDDPEPNPGLKSPPTTRPFSALPLVTSIRYQGMEKIRERLRAPVQAVKEAAERLHSASDIELCNEPETGILCLRIVPEEIPESRLNALQRYVYDAIKTRGRRSISLTKLDDKTVLRLVAISPRITAGAILETVDCIRHLAKEFRRG